MAFIQFPWRFLAISIFMVALTGGAIVPYFKGRYKLVYIILLAASILSTIGYFKPKTYVEDGFFEKFLNKDLMHQGVDLTKDYLPIWTQKLKDEVNTIPVAASGVIDIRSFEKKGTRGFSKLNVIENAEIDMPISYFPGWTVLANNNNINLEKPSEYGLVRFKLPKGSYDINFEFKDTPIRKSANYLSFASFLIVGALMLYRKETV